MGKHSPSAPCGLLVPSIFFFVFPRLSRFTVTSLMIIVFRRSREIFSAKKSGPALNRKTKLATVTEFLPARWSDVFYLQELVETKTREIRRDKHLQSLWGQKHNREATLGAYFPLKQQRQSHYDGVLYYGEWCLCLSQSGPTIACFCALSREFLNNVAVNKTKCISVTVGCVYLQLCALRGVCSSGG